MASGDVKQAQAGVATLTITAATLAASATVGRTSAAVDNTSNLYLDYLVQIKATVGVVSGNKQVLCYLYAAADATTLGYSTKSTDIDGTDKSVTIVEPNMLKLAMVLPTPTASVVHTSLPFGIAQFFGGVCPEKWGIFILNDSGVAFTAFSASYRGIYQTVAP